MGTLNIKRMAILAMLLLLLVVVILAVTSAAAPADTGWNGTLGPIFKPQMVYCCR